MKEKMKKLGAGLILVIAVPILFILLNTFLPVLLLISIPLDNLIDLIRSRKMTNREKAKSLGESYVSMCKVSSKLEETWLGKYNLFNLVAKLDAKNYHKKYLHYLEKANAEA